MSETITPATRPGGPAASPRMTGVKWGLLTLVVAIATAIYGAYGDPQPTKSQEQAVPFLAAVLTVAAVVLFGLLVPAGLRAAAARPGAWSGWALALSIVSVLALPVAFWSGLPIVVGTAGALLGAAGRRASTTGRGRATASLVLGIIGAVACLVLAVLGNLTKSS